MSSGRDRDRDRTEDVEAFHVTMEWWFSMASPVEQENRLNQFAYSRTFDMVDKNENPDHPPRYRSPRK